MYKLQNATIAVSTVLPFLALAVVTARFQARRVKKLPLKADDWTILAALILAIGISIETIYATVYAGMGIPQQNFTPELLVENFKFVYADLILVFLTYGLIKLSMIYFYKRIFTTAAFQRVADIALIATACWTLGVVLSFIFMTTPISDFWDQFGRTNVSFGALSVTSSTLEVVLDIATLCLPLPVLRSLQISTRRKFYLLCVFWLGIFCVVASAVRLYYSVLLIQVTGAIEGPPDWDYITYVINSAHIWSYIEAYVSIIAACLPSLAPLLQSSSAFDSFFKSVRSIFSKSSSTGISSEEGWNDSQRHLAGDLMPGERNWQGSRGKPMITASRYIELAGVPSKLESGQGVIERA
ncbi:hypothetical protein MMC30_003594 [Trapelia coarctata]|nr:hypothetical protein [Trapelia coarctata]